MTKKNKAFRDLSLFILVKLKLRKGNFCFTIIEVGRSIYQLKVNKVVPQSSLPMEFIVIISIYIPV